MHSDCSPITFQQIHIDVTRNATDDFNLFHDPFRWQRIHQNPYGGTIALGFQLESLIEHNLKQFRKANDEYQLIEEHGLHFSNYQFTFANAVKPGQHLAIDIKKSQFKSLPESLLSNRISVKKEKQLALMDYKKESQVPLFAALRRFAFV